MRQTRKYEFWVGIFILLGILSLLFLSKNVANLHSFNSSNSYTVYAYFDNVGGLKSESSVKIGGVVIGKIGDISLDTDTYTPKVSLVINKKYNTLPKNSTLSIKTSGIVGGQYVDLALGFADEEFEAGDEFLVAGSIIEDTKSAIVLEDLIGQFLYSSKGKSTTEEE